MLRPPFVRLATLLPLFSALCLLPALRAQTITYNPDDDRSTADVLTGSTTLDVSGSAAQSATQSGVLSGTGPVHKNGAATLFLTADNTYSGETFVDEGELTLGSTPTATPAGSVAGGITLAGGTAVNFLRSNAVTFSNDITYTGDGSGGARDGAVDINATGTSFTLAADHAINAGVFYFRGGTLNLDLGSSINAGYSVFSATNGADTVVNLANGTTLAAYNGYTALGGNDTTAATSTMNILADATVDLSTSYLAVGGLNAGGTAVLNIGTGATTTIAFAQFGGNASDTLSGNGSAATINLAPGSTLNLTETYNMVIGGSGGTIDTPLNGDGGDATINVQDATLTFDDARIILGGSSDTIHHGGNATLNLVGTGTTLNLNQRNDNPYTELYLGGEGPNSGSGTINITNGATLNVGATYLGLYASGGAGVITVSGAGSALNVDDGEGGGSLRIGSDASGDEGAHNGADGTLSVSDHATAVVRGDLYIGGSGAGSTSESFTGGNGTLSLSTGASLTATVGLTVGGADVPEHSGFGGLSLGGPAGTATVNIASGASLNFTQQMYIGGNEDNDATGNGTVNLGDGTLAGQGIEGNVSADIIISPTGTLNIGYDGTSATTAPTLTLASYDPEENGPAEIYNSGTINLRHSSGTFTLAAPMEGDGALNQIGAGSTVLTGDNSGYTGPTTVSAGQLTIQNAFASTVTVNAGGKLVLDPAGSLSEAVTLQAGAHFDNNGTYSADLTLGDGVTLGGNGTFSGLVTAESGAHLAPGNSPGTLTFTSGLTLNDGAILDFQLGSTSDLIVVSGGSLAGSASAGGITLNLSDAGGFAAGTYTLFDYTGATLSSFDTSDFTVGDKIAGYDYQLTMVGNYLQLTATASAIPEPATYAAIFGGLALLGAFVRRRVKVKVTAAL
ncbi:autotransporter-associated beta strand repeat-containing protein [Horticoccus luteus]|uniref:Autotransporter-associated beta strand repeat-containing protein n=1 Tax=Horticoccus luteus TaxID=2862869 RepID=A0A8F9XGF6_9BACT|nr:autotransporter-associated beta strand repeat-containing protein [Horticoccus luteus]QYM79147.1 autotransporter-associated beta strand repeat-containing protein [Horticoccus luteus]